MAAFMLIIALVMTALAISKIYYTVQTYKELVYEDSFTENTTIRKKSHNCLVDSMVYLGIAGLYWMIYLCI